MADAFGAQRQYKRDQGGRFSVSNALSTTRSNLTNGKLDASDVAVGAGAVLGLKGGSYAKGAYRLRKLTPEKAYEMSRHLNQVKPNRPGYNDLVANPLKLADPTYLHRLRRQSFKDLSGKAPKQMRGGLKEAKRSSDLWADTHAGVADQRRVAAGKYSAIDLINFNHRPKHRFLDRVAENSAPNTTDLFRGMNLPKRAKIGDEFDFNRSSWTETPNLADQFALGGAGIKAKRGEDIGEAIPHTFRMKAGARSTRIAGMTRTVQEEHITPKGRYRVVDQDKRGNYIVERIEKRDRNMTDAEIKRRKKAQGHISQTTGALGLAALGTRLGAKGPAKLATKVPKLKALDEARMKDVSNTLATTGAGIGGAGSFNFASYTAAESRQRKARVTPPPPPRQKKETMQKSAAEDGFYGEIGKRELFDAERKRLKRAEHYKTAADVGAGVLGAGAAQQAVGVAQLVREYNKPNYKQSNNVPRKAVGLGLKRGGRAAALTAAAGGAVYGGRKIDEKKKPGGSWSPYVAKSGQSAFGVLHD